MLGPHNHCEPSLGEQIGIGRIMNVKPRNFARQIVMSSFGNPQSNGVHLCRQYENKDTWWKFIDFRCKNYRIKQVGKG
jgi:hypothetical protein